MKKNIEIFKAINTMAEFLGVEPQNVVANLAFLDKATFKKLADVYNSVTEFYDKPFEERAKAMGFEVEKEGETTVITTVL